MKLVKNNFIKIIFIFLVFGLIFSNVSAFAQAGAGWDVITFVWNERLKLWARSSCYLELGSVNTSKLDNDCQTESHVFEVLKSPVKITNGDQARPIQNVFSESNSESKFVRSQFQTFSNFKVEIEGTYTYAGATQLNETLEVFYTDSAGTAHNIASFSNLNFNTATSFTNFTASTPLEDISSLNHTDKIDFMIDGAGSGEWTLTLKITKLKIASIHPEDAFNNLKYYHSAPPDSSSNMADGQILGQAYSPIYGPILFDESEFPADGCYGLVGIDRQPRIAKVEPFELGGEDKTYIRLLGCAYVPLLRDYILFTENVREQTASFTGIRPPIGWEGVFIEVVEELGATNVNIDGNVEIQPPYLRLFNCGWSSKNGFWSLGPNKSVETTSPNECLPNMDMTGTNISGDVNANLKKVLEMQTGVDGASVGGVGNNNPSVAPTQSKVRLGALARYAVNCARGYQSGELFVFGPGSSNTPFEALATGVVSFLLRAPIESVTLKCKDGRGFFEQEKRADGAGISVDALAISSVLLEPSVLVDGGFVHLTGVIKNNILGSIANSNPECLVTNSLNAEQTTISADLVQVSFNEPLFFVRDAEVYIQCSYTDNAGKLVKLDKSTFLVKVLPDRTVERIIDTEVEINVTLDSDSAELIISTGELENAEQELESVRLHFLDAEASSERLINRATRAVINVIDISSGTDVEVNSPSSTPIMLKQTKKIKVPISVLKNTSDVIKKVLVIEGYSKNGSRSGKRCYAFSNSGSLRTNIC